MRVLEMEPTTGNCGDSDEKEKRAGTGAKVTNFRRKNQNICDV